MRHRVARRFALWRTLRMQRPRDYKDIWCLFGMTASLGCLAFAFIGWPTLPIRGSSAVEVTELAREATRQSVLNFSLPSNDGDWTAQDIAERWRHIEEEDESPDRRAALEKSREKFAARTWPVLTKRAYIGERECWVVVSSWRTTLTGVGFCGLTSESEKAKMIADETDLNTEIAVVEARPPYAILASSTRPR